eukprot:TRINITY_DN4561_c0_g1_i1.p1 TRINITY_DN4561_c0_g1~~TRINITY_DN4561_c0_g1_i1.p1  ORF type:complete len:516 (-),score=113.27 TRINITY_DN4561_c0_g1_i1:50-1597(-)
MAEVALDVINGAGWSYADIPEMVSRVVTGQAALRNCLSPKEQHKVSRLNDALVLLKNSVDMLHKCSRAQPETAGALQDSVKQICLLLQDFEEFCDDLESHTKTTKNFVKHVKHKRDICLFLDDLTEQLLHAVRIFRFTVSLSGYVQFQKSNSLAKLIADPVACDQWIQAFGTSTSAVPFKDLVSFLDTYFSDFGRDSLEFEAACNSSTFFSWYRHEGTWSKCSTCQEMLSSVLHAEEENKSEVKLHAFAKFCGDNLLLAIRDLILKAHPADDSTNSFQIISPDLHIAVDCEEGEVKYPDGLENNQIVFVGHSDHLAELHHSVCRQVLHKTVDRIDSVTNAARFMEWMTANEPNLSAQRGKILIVVDCQTETHPDGRHNGCSESSSSEHSTGILLAEKVCKCLRMFKAYSVGVALLTCPFLIHDAGQVQQLQRNLQIAPFERQLISSDCREMSEFIGNMFTARRPDYFCDERNESPTETTTTTTSKFAAEELGDVAEEFKAAAAKMKKTKKPKKKN